NVDGSAAGDFRKLLAHRWAEKDSAAASEWVSKLPEGPISLPLLKQVAVALANDDLKSSIDWVRGLPEGNNKIGAAMAVAYEAARSSPLAALELAITLPQGRGRDDLLVHSVSQWATGDSLAAGVWAMKVSDPK